MGYRKTITVNAECGISGVMLSEAKHLNRENRPFASLRVTTIPHSPFRVHHSAFVVAFGRAALALTSILAVSAAAFGQERTPPNEPPKKVDDLGEKLIRKAVADAEEDVMATIVRLMTDASRKMEIEFDPGEETQALQGRIQAKLDEAIKVAASKQRARRQSPVPTDPDKRRMPTADKRGARPDAKAQGEPTPGSASKTADTTDSDGRREADRAGLQEARRSWGHLPRREREEVIQGVGEGFLERYRAWIERYYRALQESDE